MRIIELLYEISLSPEEVDAINIDKKLKKRPNAKDIKFVSANGMYITYPAMIESNMVGDVDSTILHVKDNLPPNEREQTIPQVGYGIRIGNKMIPTPKDVSSNEKSSFNPAVSTN